MGRFWLKTWLYTKVGAFALVVLYVLAFAIWNQGPVNIVIPFGSTITTTSLKLAAVSFICGVVCTVLVRTTLVTMRQFRQVRERNAQEKLRRDVEQVKAQVALSQQPAGDSEGKT